MYIYLSDSFNPKTPVITKVAFATSIYQKSDSRQVAFVKHDCPHNGHV